MYHIDDTIAAIASAPGGAARGIVRISGPDVLSLLSACFHPTSVGDLATIRRSNVVEGTISLSVPRAIELPADVYYWPDERSYTRQPAAEIHTIGSPPLLSSVLSALCSSGARPAQPGEFTLRAFLAGRLDLTQAEAVLGAIDARGPRDFQQALDQLAGGLARPLARLREALLDLLAQLEAGLDFVEDDIEFVTRGQVELELAAAADLLAGTLAQLTGRRQADSLPRAVLVGWPNVGKSSLFNALCGPGGALVSDQPGTTRDYLSATLDLLGLQCQLIDTAGREPGGETGGMGQMSQQLAASQIDTCDVRLLCLDASRPANGWEREQLAARRDDSTLVVLTKCDQPRRIEDVAGAVATSVRSGAGLVSLRKRLHDALVDDRQIESAARLTAERSGESLRAAAGAMGRAQRLNAAGDGEELIAAELRLALGELGKVVGAVYTDDILDRVFSRFCIGK